MRLPDFKVPVCSWADKASSDAAVLTGACLRLVTVALVIGLLLLELEAVSGAIHNGTNLAKKTLTEA